MAQLSIVSILNSYLKLTGVIHKTKLQLLGSSGNPVVIFDGVCKWCNSNVNFVIKHDKKGAFKFAAWQSQTVGRIMK
jgi:hypothetical protein